MSLIFSGIVGYSTEISRPPPAPAGYPLLSAGANAGSCVDMTFVATTALSELVWSPQKGLCLKCADGSFSKNPSLLWGAGPSNMVSGSSNDKPISKENFWTPLGSSDVNMHDETCLELLKSFHLAATDGDEEEMKTEMGLSFLQKKEDLRNNKEEDIYYPINLREDQFFRNRENNIPSLPAEPNLDAAKNDPTSEEPIVRIRDVGDGIHTLQTEIVLASQVRSVKESSAQVQNSSQQGDGRVSRDDNRGSKQSPTCSRTQRYQMKGKAKALSYGDLDERVLDMEDDSHESVESCNSAGLFSTGKKRWNFDSQLHVGSKSVKTKIQESPGSSSFVKQDSSFMNLISNMTKGFLKSKEDEAPSLALTLANHNHGHENRDKNLVPCNINQDKVCKTMGFHSFFQSLYCPKSKTQDIVSFPANNQAKESKELELDNKICDSNATPLSCRMVTGNVCKQFLPSNDKLNESTSGHGAAPAALSKLFSTSTASAQEIKRNNSAENRSSCNLATDKERNGTSSNSSLCKRKRNSAENIDTELPSEGKAVSNSRYKSDPLTSLWITRFSPKTSGPLSNQDIRNRSSGDALERSNVRNCTTSTEVSFGVNKVNGQDDEKSTSKLNSILPFSRFRNSEAMAPVFARRLDALKHIMLSCDTDDSAHGNLACFFCGIKGHHVRGCPEITGSELEGLLRNVNSYDGVKELPCVCTRCFQTNHGAFACPNASSSTRHQTENGASLVHECSTGKTMLNRRNEDDAKESDGKCGQLPTADAPIVCNERLNEDFTSGKMNLNMPLFGKDIVSSSGEKKLKENQAMPLSNFVGSQILDGPVGIFDAVKMLRLSRAVIVKLMNSNTPPSRLDGFFLRLRLGKWEQGPSGTGYCVACITGVENKSSTRNSKNSIAVNVGGVKCLVESQYISNHDFTKDELMAWWWATLKGGGKIPSEEDLRLKVEEMTMLGVYTDTSSGTACKK
ncbi:hypothetical protein SADUNF_Sadunf10G0033200 [Salix dunnii]|uniref:Plus3 domain-containing protein n=1 Tax=Salix dunnii TaxID=1413687 RepID=A0A835JS00_9ROSI|nr:hypothetical protein SADUNF_Sadunf10G0033200 [Salix dunnii]